MEIKFSAHCQASISKDEGSRWVLLMFTGYFQGVLPKDLGELEQGKRYRITIEEEEE